MTARFQPATAAGASRPARLSRAIYAPLGLYLLIVLAILAGVIWRNHGPSGQHFGIDISMFIAAADMLRHGLNPYDASALYHHERALLTHQHLAMTPARDLARAGYPPIFFWALQPLTLLPVQPAALLWMFGMVVCAASGFLVTLRALGWEDLALPLVLFLLWPQTLLGGFFNGNPIALVFLGLSLVFYLLPRHPLAAGLILGSAWLKPQLALPLGLLLVLRKPRTLPRALLGWLASSLAIFGLSLLADGPSGMRAWITSLSGYAHQLAVQPDIVSLASLYDHWAPYPLQLLFGGVQLVAAAVLSLLWWRARPAPTGFWSLWFVWFLAAPYAHFYDEILLTLPVLKALGRDGNRWLRPSRVVALYLLALSLVVSSWYPFGLNPSSLLLVLVALLVSAGPAFS